MSGCSMRQASRTPQGWVSLYEAADRLRLHFETVRTLVHDGHFTRLRKTPGKSAAIYIPEDEIEAHLTGGLDAVATVRKRKARAANRKPAKVAKTAKAGA